MSYKVEEIRAMGNKNLVKRRVCPKCKDGYYNQNDTASIVGEGMCTNCKKEGVK